MTGIVGGTVSETALDGMEGELHDEQWYGHERFELGDCSLALVHHGERDKAGQSICEAALAHLSISPKTTSMVPMIAATSASWWPPAT